MQNQTSKLSTGPKDSRAKESGVAIYPCT